MESVSFETLKHRDGHKTTTWPLSHCDRLARQVVHLESSVEGITSRIELIMEKLGLQEKAKGNDKAGRLTVTKNEVSIEILMYTCIYQMVFKDQEENPIFLLSSSRRAPQMGASWSVWTEGWSLRCHWRGRRLETIPHATITYDRPQTRHHGVYLDVTQTNRWPDLCVTTSQRLVRPVKALLIRSTKTTRVQSDNTSASAAPDYSFHGQTLCKQSDHY